MNLNRVQEKREELSSQQYDIDRTVHYKKGKSTLPNITSSDIMETCEVRYENHDDSSTVVMEDFVNDKLG